jgi:RNA polymerase sigma-70 factor, ECF subfamily
MTTQISDQKDALRKTQETILGTSSFEQIYQQYRQVLGSYLARCTGNHELAEDLTQETFVKAWQVQETQQAPKHVKAWLYRVARHRSINEYRRATRNGRVTVSSLQEVEEDLKDNTALSNLEECYETQELVRTTLARMNQAARQILLLALQEGNSYREISKLLNMTLPSVRMRIYRARKIFQALYREEEETS